MRKYPSFRLTLQSDYFEPGDIISLGIAKNALVLRKPRRSRSRIQSVVNFLTFGLAYRYTNYYVVQLIDNK